MTETAVPAAAPLLAVRGLSHAFGARRVLEDLSFELGHGEVLGLLGPNGSGKSTALSVLTGLRARQGGEVLWRGRPLPGQDRAYRTELGVVFQSPSVDPKLTARQNLLLAGRLAGLGRAERSRRAERLLAAAGLADRSGDLVRTFSGGMKRRLDLARALVAGPSLLLMDEPTSGLDEAAFRETWQRLEALRADRELSILLSTHRPEEAERCDRIAVLAGGRVAALDTPEALRERVAADVVTLVAADAASLAPGIEAEFGVPCRVHGDELVIDCERGHELIPRLVESLPDGRLRAVSLRRPTLADAFLKVTGLALDEDVDTAGAA